LKHPDARRQPTRAYFGQKDIQQALLLRRMCGDLLLAHPLPQNLHIVPTYRSLTDGLALSSRNVYLTAAEREVACVLYRSLRVGEQAWKEGGGREGAVTAAVAHIAKIKHEVELDKKNGGKLTMVLDYIEMNDPESFETVDWDTKEGDGRPIILSGALWLGRTRLIDNIVLGDVQGKIIL
jgi:pantoate--beta-alanine ligase